MRFVTSNVGLRSYCLNGLPTRHGKASQDTQKTGKALWEFSESTIVGRQQDCEMVTVENANWMALDSGAITRNEV